MTSQSLQLQIIYMTIFETRSLQRIVLCVSRNICSDQVYSPSLHWSKKLFGLRTRQICLSIIRSSCKLYRRLMSQNHHTVMLHHNKSKIGVMSPVIYEFNCSS
jgi:hypothetical protein